MAEFIDRDKTIAEIDDCFPANPTSEFSKGVAVGLAMAKVAVNHTPTADVRPVPDGGIGEMSDGYHTFNGLYYQRMVLFAALVKAHKDKAWKSWKHEDGELCFGGGWFIVGIDTPEGSYTYHYDKMYWNLFECEELPTAKHWDGHTEKDVTRLLSLDVRPVVRGTWGHRWICSSMSGYEYACSCSVCDKPTYRISLLEKMPHFCPNCGGEDGGKLMDELIKRLRYCRDNAAVITDDELMAIADQAADAIEELTGFVQEAERDRDEYRERLDKANDAIEELSKKRDAACWGCKCEKIEPSVWIPVTERLPKEEETVLAFGTLGVAWLDWRHDNKWCCYGGVTHWMPLPQPPKEE